jgi:hypothetical protein
VNIWAIKVFPMGYAFKGRIERRKKCVKGA